MKQKEKRYIIMKNTKILASALAALCLTTALTVPTFAAETTPADTADSAAQVIVLQDGLKNGLTNGLKSGLKSGLVSGTKNGLTNGLKQSVKNGLTNGLCSGLKNGMVNGLKNGALKA